MDKVKILEVFLCVLHLFFFCWCGECVDFKLAEMTF